MNQFARNRFAVIFSIMVIGLALLGWLLSRKFYSAKEIEAELAKLRASGEPTTAAELAVLFPNPTPAQDASILFGPVFDKMTNKYARLANPVAFFNWSPARRQSLAPALMKELGRLVAATRDITNVWPGVVPEGSRFPMHWERGTTNTTMFNFLAVHTTVQLLVAHAMHAAESGDPALAAEALTKAFQFTRTLNSDAMIVGHAVRHGLDGVLCQTTEWCLSRAKFSEASLEQLNQAIELESDRGWIDALRTEHCMGLWAFDFVMNGGTYNEVFVYSGNESFWKRLFRWFDFDRDRRPLYSDSDYLLFLRTIPNRIRMTEMPILEAMTASENARGDYFSNVVSQIGSAVYPGFSKKFLEAHAQANARMRALKVAIAIERHRTQKTKLTGLQELVPAFLPVVPRDPFDNQSLRFKALPGGYVVYSIGPDGVDNHGTEHRTQQATTNQDITIVVEQ